MAKIGILHHRRGLGGRVSGSAPGGDPRPENYKWVGYLLWMILKYDYRDEPATAPRRARRASGAVTR